MSYFLNRTQTDALLSALQEEYRIFAPRRYEKAGRYSDTDIIRYGEVHRAEEIVFHGKPDFPAKEVITPIQQAIFYFTEDEWRASKGPSKKFLVFAHPCDINSQRIRDRIFLQNGGFEDLYYSRVQSMVKYVWMDCGTGADTCFCVSMGQNKPDRYSLAVKEENGEFFFAVNDAAFEPYFENAQKSDFVPHPVEKNPLKLNVPKISSPEVLLRLKQHPMWEEFNHRCTSCGACTIACATCTCFTTRDIPYSENGEVGERRRVEASCQIDDFTTVAGGGSYRKTAGERMRYKVLHKFHDYKARFPEEDMCVGCGRCIMRCPQAISIVATVEKMSRAIDEIEADLAKEGTQNA